MSIDLMPMVPLGSPKVVEQFHVYSYEHLDDLSFTKDPREVFDDSPSGRLASYIEAVSSLLKKAGWEGDGDIKVIWFPPFVDVGVEDTWGTYVWCVKQDNNGTSWLASPTDLNFKRLLAQNNQSAIGPRARLGVMFTQCSGFLKRLKKVLADTKQKTEALRSLSDPTFKDIRDEILLSAQGDMVGQFNVFLDDCYLEILDEVLSGGNTSNLKLSKFKTNLEPKEYATYPELPGEDAAEANQWFTMRGLISDIWKTYQFEPFPQKISMLFKACEFPTDVSEMRMIGKHVYLRNCVQHHERAVTQDALRLAGVDRFEILQDDGSSEFWTAGSAIVFSLTELERFVGALVRFNDQFYKHTRKRIRRKTWVHRPKKSKKGAAAIDGSDSRVESPRSAKSTGEPKVDG